MQRRQAKRSQLQGILSQILSNPASRQALGYAAPWLMNMVQSSQLPGKIAASVPKVATALPGMAKQIATDGYKGIQSHMTGGVPLVTGEPGRPHTKEDTRQGAMHSMNALGAAGVAAVGLPARAAALGARTRPAVGFSSVREQPTGTYYHGTDKDFSKFDIDKSKDIGIHFGNLDTVYDRQAGRKGYIDNGQRTIPADLSMSNPVRMDDLGRWEPEKIAGELGIVDEFFEKFPKIGELNDAGRDLAPALAGEAYQWLREKIHTKGHDGIVYNNMYESPTGADSYIATKPGTVKSATTGNTLFSNTKQASPASVFTAYHGSPHDFDKFSMDKIGTGEGAQAYGHGLYFAEAEDVAKSYKDVHVGQNQVLDSNDEVQWEIKKALDRHNGDKTAAKKDLAELLKEREKFGGGYQAKVAGQALTDFDKFASKGFGGHMYEVQINANKDDFLDWDKTFDQQPQAVRDAISNNVDLAHGTPDDLKFGGIYQQMQTKLGGEAAATKVLKDAGVPGIRYLDGHSRGAGQGSQNYVLFDADLAEIKRKYAQAGIPLPPEYREMERETPKQRRRKRTMKAINGNY